MPPELRDNPVLLRKFFQICCQQAKAWNKLFGIDLKVEQVQDKELTDDDLEFVETILCDAAAQIAEQILNFKQEQMEALILQEPYIKLWKTIADYSRGEVDISTVNVELHTLNATKDGLALKPLPEMSSRDWEIAYAPLAQELCNVKTLY